MAGFVEQRWAGTPGAATRAERRPCVYQSYLPDALVGRPLSLSGTTLADVGDVEQAVRALQRTTPGLVALEALARLLLRAEAVASSFIEGLQVNVRRLAKEELAVTEGLPTSDETARAVLANVSAMQYAVELGDPGRGPLTVEDVCELHRRLLAGGRDERWGGVLREEQNWVGGRGLTPCSADFVPPPPDRVAPLMGDLCGYLSGDEHPAVVQAALVHAQFETIHPFVDGNGRVGRTLIHVVLRRRGLVTGYVPPVSLVLATHSGLYVQGLTAYRYLGDAAGGAASVGQVAWLDRFLADTGRACADAELFAARIGELEEGWRRSVGKVRARSATDQLLAALPGLPVLTVATAARHLGRSKERVNDAVNRLEAAGVLRKTTLGRRNRAFEAPDLLAAVTGFERALASPTGDTRTTAPVRPVPAAAAAPPAAASEVASEIASEVATEIASE